MTRFILLGLLALTPAVAPSQGLAQDAAQDAAQAAVTTLIAPMLDEIAPGAPGAALTSCVVTNATPEEITTLAAATSPSDEVGAMVTAILARQPTIDCATAALGG